MQNITFKIFRYNPEDNTLYRYDSFKIECGPFDQLLDILIRVKEDFAPGLAFRKSCRHGICGSCAVRVNNKPILACKTSVYSLSEEFGPELTIDPLSAERVLRDLIIDKEDYWQKYISIEPFTNRLSEKNGEIRLQNTVLAGIADADYCIQCGACYYICPVVKVQPDFLGPSAFTKAFRFEMDPRDYSAERLKIINSENAGVWDCVKCLQCIEACPKNINPFEKITRLHEAGVNELPKLDKQRIRHAKGFRLAVSQVGFINELVLAFYTMRLRMIRMVPRGVLMFLKRKIHINPLLPRSKRLSEIRREFKRSRK